MVDLPSIHAALAAVKDGIGAVGKDQRNTMQNFNFRGVDAVVNAAAPLLNKHGVITVPEVLDAPVYETVEVGSKRTPMAHVILRVAYHFYGPAGDAIRAVVVSESMDSGDKAMPKAMSVAYRIALLQVLNLPTTEKDPDEESYERSRRGDEPTGITEPKITVTGNRTGRIVSPKKDEPKSARAFIDEAKKTSDVAELRTVYKAAGAAGLLKEKVTIGGETLALEDWLQRRNGEIAHPKSAGAAGEGTGGSGD